MQTPLNASASTAGALFSSSTFVVPQFQREYSWDQDEVEEFWRDLHGSIESGNYFLGLIILIDDGQKKTVVDGQQRLITLSLLAAVIYFEAVTRDRNALADRIRADFLESIDYDSDQMKPRVALTDYSDDATFQHLLEFGVHHNSETGQLSSDTISSRMIESFEFLQKQLRDDLIQDPFKILGKWAEFITNRIYFAVFVHPDSSNAYQVFEVINTRGKELTTADLLKNYVLSQTSAQKRDSVYERWQNLHRNFPPEGPNTFVQYIRHAVTVESGHILPKDLFSFLSERLQPSSRRPPSPEALVSLLEKHLPIYSQMMDPTVAGPAEEGALKVFASLNQLGVIAIRPILLAVAGTPNSLAGMEYILRLVVRRIIVGTLGTGNVERRFGEAARKVHDGKKWEILEGDLRTLNPDKEEFEEQLRKRSFNKRILAFIRRSIILRSITPEPTGVLHYIWTRQMPGWGEILEEDGAFWASTIGNTILSNLDRRPKGANSWFEFKALMLPHAVKHEWRSELEAKRQWDVGSIESIGRELARVAGDVWY